MTLPPPFAEDLVLDRPLEPAPSLTLDEGVAASYLAITGDPLPLALSAPLSRAVTGQEARLANPALVFSVAIGQSTVATRRVIANLNYRDVVLARQVHLGETISTTVRPVAAEWTSSRAERAKVLLDISVRTDGGDDVAHFQRLALLPVFNPDAFVERAVPALPEQPGLESFLGAVPAWNGAAHSSRFSLTVGASFTDALCDTVSSARELVRLTLNVAAAHRDARAGIEGVRLAYGGHTVALGQASLSRGIEGLLTVVAWRSCDHLGPVFENDLLQTTTTILAVHPAGAGLALVDARVTVAALRSGVTSEVLDWRPVLLVATAEGA